VSTAPLPARCPSAFVADDEPVFQSGTRIPGVAVPVFGATGCWPATCLPRPANRRLSQWQICFPETDPVWNLRLREVAFALLNPAHDSVRAAGVFQKADPKALSTVILIIRKLTVLAAWAAGKGFRATSASGTPGISRASWPRPASAPIHRPCAATW